MMRARYFFLVAICLALIVVTGCRKNAPQVAAAPPPPPAAKPPAPLTEDEAFQKKSLEQLNAERPLGDVFFDLDVSDVRTDARPVLQANSDWMKRWTTTQIMLEGHGDSRGTSEYNLALGTRRANSVRDYLVSLGVPTARITVVSKGKEAPFCTEENEACWQQNRRGHFVITKK